MPKNFLGAADWRWSKDFNLCAVPGHADSGRLIVASFVSLLWREARNKNRVVRGKIEFLMAFRI